MSRVVVHLDADAFFASVEEAADARLRGKPVAVGGERRGIIASASYEARKFGVYTPMPTARARKLCPKLIVLPGDFERYEQFSNWMFGYCYDFTPEVEQTSIDEGYFDLTANRTKPPVEIALTIRRAIGQSLKISVSEGIGANKLVSQIASKLNKPAAFRQVPAGGEKKFLHSLPNRWLPGVGPKTSARLNAAGLAEIRHIAATPLDLLELLLGNQARQLRQFANGIDERPLIPVREPAKSFSQQETFSQDLTDEEYLEAVLRRMADRLFAKVREERKSIRTLTVKVRYNDMAEDQCSESLLEPTDLETDLYGRIRWMMRRAWKRRVSLRMVSLKLSNVYDGLFRSELPLETEAQRRESHERLARVVDELRRTHGSSVVLRGHDFRLREPLNMGQTFLPAPPSNVAVPELSVRSSGFSRSGPPQGGTPNPGAGLAFQNRQSPIANRQSAVGYVPLRIHSYYSFLDSTLSPEAIVQLAAQHDCPAIALTDTGNLHGTVEFVQAAQKAGIQPILGVELTLENQPLLLYVESARGYHNLCRLLSRHAVAHTASRTGTMNRLGIGRVPLRRCPDQEEDREATERFPPRKEDGADLRGSREDYATADSVAARQRAPFRRQELEGLTDGLLAASGDTRLADLFPGSFYVAARRDISDGRFPVVPCPAVHYGTPDDRLRYDIVQSIRTLTLLRQRHPEKRPGGSYYFRTPAEMQAACHGHSGWLAQAREIAGRCRFEFPFGKPQFPAFRSPDGSSAREFLRQLVIEGLHRRYHERRIVSDTGAVVPREQVQAQVETELSIITEVGYEDLFLITWDLLQTCRERGIEWITRGSAADSLVCYCLGISDVCPIRFGLYFRRFLNQERMALHKLPDIDVDFPHDRKDDVVDLLFEKYGTEHCAVVGGFSTFQARSAVADVAKVLGVSEFQIRRFTEHFPWSFGGGWVPIDSVRPRGSELIEKLKASPECADLPLAEEPFKTAVETAAFLDGFPRHPKMHPCGVVLSRQPLHELTPTFLSNKGWSATHLDMDAVEAVGLVKMDILAQGGLAVMRDARQSLAAKGIQVELPAEVRREKCEVRKISDRQSSPPMPESGRADLLVGQDARQRVPTPPFHDPEVWELIAGGDARAVHHIESPAMVSLCRMCNVREIDGLIAIVSVIRPGAANEQKKVKFTRRYQRMEPPEYPHPSLEPCLRSTLGLVVYEEHILQICEAFAGLNPGRADVLRRALVKQNWSVVEEIAAEFGAAARARGHSQEKIREVWELVTGFNGYAFCKAHSTAYGVEAYQAAWLKRYYPAEFMAAVLTNGKGFYHPLVYVLECHRLGLKLLPPSVNQPGPEFKAESPHPDPLPSDGRGDNNYASDKSGRQLGDPCAEWSALSHPMGEGRGEGRLSPASFIRVPLVRAKGLTQQTIDRLLAERERGSFVSLADFHRRVGPLPEEAETMIRVGAFDEFGPTPTQQFWEWQHLNRAYGQSLNGQGWLLPALTPSLSHRMGEGGPAIAGPGEGLLLSEPTRRQRLLWEREYFDFTVGGHPLELHDDVAWDTYCPVARLGEHVGEEVVTCGLIVEQRTHHQVTGEPMKFLTLADWTGMVETELFAPTYRSYGLATVRYPVLEVTARVEPFENGRGFSLRVLHAGKPRTK
jgi:DNA polymerase III alpha subunit/nucleotidyltransferase/DNA polymerase involved in DNA repair